MADERYVVKYPLPDNIANFVATLRRRERSGEIESSQTNGYLAALSDAGWTLRAIANALNNVNIEAVRERIAKGRKTPPEFPFTRPEISESPSRTKRNEAAISKSARKSQESYRIPEDVEKVMSDLQVIAREVRGTTPADSPKRVASIRLTHIMHEERENGASFVELGRAAGVTWSAVKFRLGRYNFHKLPKSMAHTAMEDLSGTPSKS